MPYPINAAHRLLLENGDKILLEDGSSFVVLNEQIGLDDPLNAATLTTLPTFTFFAEAYDSPKISLVDDFKTTFDTGAWTRNDATRVAIANQQLQFTTLTTSGYYEARSNSTYNMTGASMSVLVNNAGNQTFVSLEVYPVCALIDDDNYLFWLITNGSLSAYSKVATASNLLVTVTYNPIVHKYLRIREFAGTSFWDYSTDGVSWVVFYAMKNPIPVTALKALIQVGNYAVEAAGTTVLIDSFNILPTGMHYELQLDTVNTFDSQ